MRQWTCLLSFVAFGLCVSLAGQSAVEPPGARRPVVPTVARIAPVPEALWSDAQRKVAAGLGRTGRPDAAFDTLLQVPALADAVTPYTIYLSDDSTLPPPGTASS
jgi:hypothetical protein